MQNVGQLLEEKPGKEQNFFGISVSKLKTFKDCKTKYHYAYIKRFPRKLQDFHIFGKFLHKVLEDFHKAKLVGTDLSDSELMKQCYISAKEEYKDTITLDQLKECKEILTIYLQQLDAKIKLGTFPKILDVEREFYVDINGKILLNGFIDRVQLDPDGVLHVADYKTSWLYDKDEHGQLIVVNDYTKTKKYKRYAKDVFQLMTYAYVMFLENPELEKVRASFIMLRHNTDDIKIEVTREKALEIEKYYIDTCEKILNEKLFRPSPSILCKWCDFLDDCNSGQDYLGIVKPYFGEISW